MKPDDQRYLDSLFAKYYHLHDAMYHLRQAGFIVESDNLKPNHAALYKAASEFKTKCEKESDSPPIQTQQKES